LSFLIVNLEGVAVDGVFEPEPFGAVFEGACEFAAEDFWTFTSD